MEAFTFYMLIGAALFGLGCLGVLLRRDAIVLFMCIELMLNGANLSLVAISREFGSIDGQVYVFFIMAIAAAEAAVGLGIILSVYRNFYTVDVERVSLLRG